MVVTVLGLVMIVRVLGVWLWRAAPVPPGQVEAWRQRARVAAVVPAYNEDPDAVVRTVHSLYTGTCRPDVVFIVDDGSASREGIADLLYRAARSDMPVHVLPMAMNQGKRFAQAEAWLSVPRGAYDVWLIIDSDTTVGPHAVERMVDAFADPTINAATSLILPRNRGILPLLQEVEYARCVLVNRLLWNWVGAVEVISGGFSAVRDQVVRDNLPAYLRGYWGTHVGDDRHMAIMANATGRVVVVPGARSYTEVPDRPRKLLRQRARWARSYYLGAAWTLRYMPQHRIAAVMAWMLAHSMVGYALLVTLIVRASWQHAPALLAYFAVISWLQAYRYLQEPSPDPARQFLAWLLTPVQSLIGMLVLTPVRLWGLATCRTNAWGTR